MKTDLLSVDTLVESPFIVVKIGDYTFGNAQKVSSGNQVKVTYPNYMQSIRVDKVNGQVNTYTIAMEYAITAGDDPNMLEKVFSSVGVGAKIYISYGDYNSPDTIYKEEEALLLKVTQNVDFSSSKIAYTITATGVAQLLASTYNNFPRREEKPSTVMTDLLKNSSYGLTKIFTGMQDLGKVLSSGIIRRDDKKVEINAKQNMNMLDYLRYLTSCMIPINRDPNAMLGTTLYGLNIIPDTTNQFGGPYFEVKKVSKDASTKSSDYYEIDIGYPGDNLVMSFSIKEDQTYSLYYDYSGKISQNEYTYNLGNNGRWEATLSPKISSLNKYKKTTASSEQWWSQMVNFPISATMTIKGLVKPSLLMQYVYINTYFYGQQHISSGLYAITSQQDVVDANGYRTTLGLLRIGEQK